MGEPVAVEHKKSSKPGYLRFETNRVFTGMGHERYLKGEEIFGDRPPDRLAEMLFEKNLATEVHVYAQSVTVKVVDGVAGDDITRVIEDLYTHYLPGVEVPTEESFT